MAGSRYINLPSHEKIPFRRVQQSEQVMRLLTMMMHFHSAVSASPRAIFTEISPAKDAVT